MKKNIIILLVIVLFLQSYNFCTRHKTTSPICPPGTQLNDDDGICWVETKGNCPPETERPCPLCRTCESTPTCPQGSHPVSNRSYFECVIN